jgi:hypothetical protein
VAAVDEAAEAVEVAAAEALAGAEAEVCDPAADSRHQVACRALPARRRVPHHVPVPAVARGPVAGR